MEKKEKKYLSVALLILHSGVLCKNMCTTIMLAIESHAACLILSPDSHRLDFEMAPIVSVRHGVPGTMCNVKLLTADRDTSRLEAQH